MKPAKNSAKAWQFQDILLETYCFTPNLSVPRHSHDEYQIGLTLTAPGEYQYRGEGHLIPIRGFSVLHPGEMHTGRSLGTGDAAIVTRKIYVPPARMLAIVAEVAGSSTMPFIGTPILVDQHLLGRFLQLHECLGGVTTQLEQESLLLFALAQLVLRYAEIATILCPHRTAPQSVQRVREYLHDHYAENVSLTVLAQLADLSPFHLCRMFAAEIGLPPHRYQTQVRIAQAKTLLMRGVPLEQVAFETGFSHQSHFGRHFKRLVGVTPGQYVGSSNNVIDPKG